MDEEKFNLSVRKFLKKVGITAQREIEIAVREAVKAGALGDGARLGARVLLSVEPLGLERTIEGTIELG